MKICKIKDCQTKTTPDSARGYCTKHYLRLRRYGDPNFFKLAKHYKTGTPTHNSWLNMNKRCHNPTSNRWHLYGGRGIAVCERWSGVNGFTNFLADMGERPEGKSLDRIDPDGNYKPSNCRWATAKEQRLNQRALIGVLA